MLLDLVLALALVVISYRTITARLLFEAIVYFVTLGVMLALIWARMGAVDVALAEIALGSGITGALLFDTYAFLKKRRRGVDV